MRNFFKWDHSQRCILTLLAGLLVTLPLGTPAPS